MRPYPFHLGSGIVLSLSTLPVLHLLRATLSHWSADHGALQYSQLLALVGLLYAVGVGVYRLTLHPLAKYPGPLIGALINWYTIYYLVNGKRHLDLYRQHEYCGKYVRYSPSRLSINSAEASIQLHDVNANTYKGDFYSVAKVIFGADMSQTTTDKKKHAFRRRINMTALTPAAVKSYGTRITPQLDFLTEQIGHGIDSSGGWGPPQDMSKKLAYCIADMMGCITFGKSWDTQKSTTNRKMVEEGPLGVVGMVLLGHMQGLLRFGLHKVLFKPLIDGAQELISVAESWATWREQQKFTESRDIWAALLEARDPKTGQPYTREELVSEATMMITAGSDTVTTASCATLFYLIHNPKAMERVVREIRDALPLPDKSVSPEEAEFPAEFASKELQGMTFLLACIDETMRLSPPLLSILPRVVDKGGMIVEGEFFPEGITLGIPHYAMHRDPANFPEPHSYIPERWIPEDSNKGRANGIVPSTGHEEAAGLKQRAGDGMARGYTPFGAGRGSCIGKHLAYQEMTYILARLLWLFDVRAEPEADVERKKKIGNSSAWREDEFQSLDRFVSSQEGPVVQFRYREELRRE